MRTLPLSTLGLCAALSACANTTIIAGAGGSAAAGGLTGTTTGGEPSPSSSETGQTAIASTVANASNAVSSSATSSSSGAGGSLGVQRTDKVDLLFMIDNSRSMADKQKILATAVPDLVNALTSPPCLDANGAPLSPQPFNTTDTCPPGSHHEFHPVTDMHIGIITSSLGSHGGDACPDIVMASSDCNGGDNSDNNDHGHLITRADACGTSEVKTYQNVGFLAWDPAQKDNPPGETSLALLMNGFTSLVSGTGQIGCGFESQLESWLRFLVDPAPYQTISLQGTTVPSAVKQGTDEVLLQQRADFLRPDSLLAIVMLTDENDGSAIEGGTYYVVEDAQPKLPPPRSECAVNPLDKCCLSCDQTGTAAAAGCPSDPACSTTLDDVSDNFNQRMFDEKRRFGIDFLYPVQRYVNALTLPTIDPSVPDLTPAPGAGVPNPIFANATGGQARDPGLVVLAGIVGVPWQDIAEDPTDLSKGFKSSAELATVDPKTGLVPWDVILGNPATYIPPLDPHMIEQFAPRSGTNPITNTAIAPPSSPSGTDPISGHEYTVTPPGSDLQYACTFTLPEARDCSVMTTSCDCTTKAAPDNPLCNGTMQVSAKAYPGLRHLSVLKGLGPNGIVGSICAEQLSDATSPDYGYRPTVSALLAKVKSQLVPDP